MNPGSLAFIYDSMITKIPIEIVALEGESYHLFVPVKFNGTPFELIIDTGASRTVFSSRLGTELNVPVVDAPGEIQTAGVGSGALETWIGRLEELQVGELHLQSLEVVFLDLDSINQLYNHFSSKHVAGLLGSDFLRKYKARVDYGKKILTLKY
jgi:hypothetical protein